MKESPNKRGRENSLLPWLLLGILAVCLAIFLYFYGQENNYTLLSDDYSQTESGIASPEENSTSSQISDRESSPAFPPSAMSKRKATPPNPCRSLWGKPRRRRFLRRKPAPPLQAQYLPEKKSLFPPFSRLSA